MYRQNTNLMQIHEENYRRIVKEAQGSNANVVAVSKTKPVEAVKELYDMGHLDFGENYVQELVDKQAILPKDIRWHFIGHLQSNKVKYIAPFVHLIHGIDSSKLLNEVNKQAVKQARVIDVLLQIHISTEETKFGLDETELASLFSPTSAAPVACLKNIRIRGLMGMASFSNDAGLVRSELKKLKHLYDTYKNIALENCDFKILSMGMSGDYHIALEEGSNLIRIGSLLFGSR